MKKLCVVLIILFLISSMVLFYGCSQNKYKYTKKNKIVIGYSTPSLQNSFWVSVTTAMKKKAQKENVELLIRDAVSDTAKQAADIEDLIQQDVDVMLITPYDSVSLIPSINAVNKAGIPLVIVDIGIIGADYDCLIITDNILGGRLAGKWLVDYLKKNNIKDAKVATIQAQLGADNARERHNGFMKVMEENNINVVAGQTADSLRDKAMTVMEDFLQSYPDLTAVFVECDAMSLGALQAVKQANADTIIIGYDGDKEACRNIKKGGNMKADIDQQPDKMAEKAIDVAIKLHNGGKVPKSIQIVPKLITKENVDEYLQ